jgi:hypothetical protein
MSDFVVNVRESLIVNLTEENITVNVPGPEQSLVVNVVGTNPTIERKEEIITLDVASGGLVPTGGADLTCTAGTNLSALRAVTFNNNGEAVYASNNTIANAQVVGITIISASIGQPVTIAAAGLFADNSWSWTKGPVFLGTNGMLTQTAPTNGAVLVYVARALTPTTIQIDIDTTILTV